MALPNLKDKRIYIVTPYERMAELDLGFALRKLGADVRLECLPVHPATLEASNLDKQIAGIHTTAKDINAYNEEMKKVFITIKDLIGKNVTPIDALVIHQADMTKHGAKNLAIELVKSVKNKCPIVVCDYCEKKTFSELIRRAGANFFDLDKLNFEPLAAAVAEVISQNKKQTEKLSIQL